MIPDHILFPATGVRFRYPFATMAVGDYFLVTIQEVAKSAYNSARHHGKVNPGRKYEKLRVPGEGWRIIRVA
jgi:hypothetical protein